MPTYFACRWEHLSSTGPVVLCEELDDERMETRKVHRFRDGTLERSDRVQEKARTTLGWAPVPPLSEIAARPQFTVLPLDAAEFERVWNSAADSAPSS